MKRILFSLLALLAAVTAYPQTVSNQRVLSQMGAPFNQSGAEAALSITPTNYGYPPGHPFRYMTQVQIANVLSGGTPTQDVTAALQTTLNLAVTAPSNARYNVYWPAGHYLISSGLTIPNGNFVDIGGAGRGTILYATSGGSSPIITWSFPSCCLVARSHIHDLTFEGLGSSADMLSLSGISNVWLDRLHFNDVPAGKDAIHVNGSGGVNNHEVHIRDAEVYQSSAVAGNAAIEFGSNAADSEVTRLVMEGDFAILYGVELDSSASSISISDSHISNLATNSLLLAGSNTRVSLVNDFFDSANSDIVSIGASTTDIRFVADRFFNVPSGFSGIKIASSTGITGSNLDFAGLSTAAAMVTETGSADFNSFSQVQTSGAFTAPAAFTGLHSAFRVSGVDQHIGGVSLSQAAATTKYIGLGAVQANATQVEVPLPFASIARHLVVQTDTAPAGVQTFVATVEDNGADTACTATITGAAFAAESGCAIQIPANDSVSIKIVSSATAATGNIRATLTLNQ